MDEARLVLARTIYGEARGEGREGMEAVAQVIMNRATFGGWWGDSVIEVCLKPWQFSAWNQNDPNRAIIEKLKPNDGNALFDLAYEIAGEAIAGTMVNRVGSATHYHTTYVSPNWKDSSKQVAAIGNHLFYAGIG